MKKLLLAFLFGICLSACTNRATHNPEPQQPLKGKLVISAICGHYVVQVLNKIDSLLVDNWKDQSRNATFNAVFSIDNFCEFGNSGIKEGEEFNFEFISKSTEDCARCKAYYPIPNKYYSIRVIK